MISDFLLSVLACPKCDSRPAVQQKAQFLVCTECQWAYRIVDGIPDMLAEDAIAPEDWKSELGQQSG